MSDNDFIIIDEEKETPVTTEGKSLPIQCVSEIRFVHSLIGLRNWHLSGLQFQM